jgi:DNA-binding response OmpR family regulator
MKSPINILLIEDDLAVAQSLQAGLEREQFIVTWKELGSQGIDFARAHHPQLILLDIRLPDGSGFDFCRQMRQSGLRQPIIFLTAQDEEMDKVLGLEMGADDYITKPFGLRELISRIRAQLRRAYGDLSNSDSNIYYIGDVTLDLTRGLVMKANQIISFTPIEFRLLTFLAQHRNQALYRSQIIDSVWGHSADPDTEKTVNVHIRHIREKIELDPEKPVLLLTVPGIGYRLTS